MVAPIRVRVPAKVNLALLVGEVDESGYHELGTVFHAVSLFDEVEVENAPAGVFELTISGLGQGELPTDRRNLAIRAAQLLADHCQANEAGVRIRIHKRIPIAGGMAGGSADAAGTLMACAGLWGLSLTGAELTRLGARLGADVPFALLGGTAVGTRRGDVLTPVATRGELRWVFATSRAGLSTPEVFARFDQLNQAGPTTVSTDLLVALGEGDLSGVASSLANDLESAALDLRPELGEVLECGRLAGALGSVLSGSGPTCAFLVSDDQMADRVSEQLSRLPQVREVLRASGPVAGAHPQG